MYFLINAILALPSSSPVAVLELSSVPCTTYIAIP